MVLTLYYQLYKYHVTPTEVELDVKAQSKAMLTMDSVIVVKTCAMIVMRSLNKESHSSF